MKAHELIAQQRDEIAELKGLVAQLACELEAAQNVTIRLEETPAPAHEYKLRSHLSAHNLFAFAEIAGEKATLPNTDTEAFRAAWRARIDNLDGEVK